MRIVRSILFILSALSGATGFVFLCSEGVDAAPQVCGIVLILVAIILYLLAGVGQENSEFGVQIERREEDK